MNSILYIEDEEVKAKEVDSFLSSFGDVMLEKSLNSGIRAIRDNVYDFILLDMSLPLYDYDCEYEEENDFETFAGIDILEELMRQNRNDKVIVITAFDILGEGENEITIDQLNSKLLEEYKDIYLGIIYYDSSSLEWRRNLKSIMEDFV